jgi:pimeloyl-ACP methyl ester carboxylesterase
LTARREDGTYGVTINDHMSTVDATGIHAFADNPLGPLETVTWYTDFPPFESITVPTLVISGTEDYLAPPPISEAMAARIPGARRVLIEDCGHLCNFEKPAEFNVALQSFLEQAGVRV